MKTKKAISTYKGLITQNDKLKKTSKLSGFKVFNFGIPAYKSCTGLITCPSARTCVKKCYARKKAYTWSNVKPAYERRLKISLMDTFIDQMQERIDSKKVDFLRVHDSGDYYSDEYLQKWFKIAKNNPQRKFYSYTNEVKKIKELNSIPENYAFIFSTEGKDVNLIDANDRHARIFDTVEELEKAGYIDASNNDLLATPWVNPDNNKIGLIKH